MEANRALIAAQFTWWLTQTYSLDLEASQSTTTSLLGLQRDIMQAVDVRVTNEGMKGSHFGVHRPVSNPYNE